jgi:uncharacterized lipoprotein YmbA
MSAEALQTVDILSHIETFLLPNTDDRYVSIDSRRRKDFSSSPSARLDDILHQVVLADHIRTMQIMYRDSDDELTLAAELREVNANLQDAVKRLPTKHLMEKLSEGRSRVLALCRLCHGKGKWVDLWANL